MQVRKSAVTLWVLVLLGMVIVSGGCSSITVKTPTPETVVLQATQTAIALTQLEVELKQTQTALAATQTAMFFTATPIATPTQAEPTPVPPTATPEPTDTQTVGPTDTPTSTSTLTDTPTPPPPPPPLLIIYDDALHPGWEDWSWDCRGNFSSAGLVREGEYAVAVEYEKGWGGLAFGRHASVSTQGYNRVEFWVHGGASGGQLLRVSFNTCKSNCELPPGGLSINNPKYVEDGIISPDTWKLVSVPLADLGAVDVSIVKFNIMDNSGSAQPTFYIDDVVLVKK